MAYMDAKSKHGMTIEMKEKGYVSLKQTAGEDEYYSTIGNADNTVVTARIPPVQPPIPNRVQNQQAKNIISDSQLQFSLKNMKDDIDLLKRKNNRLKMGLIISSFVTFVAIGAVSATAVIFKQNLEDSLKMKTETQLISTNEAQVSEGTWTRWSNWDACSATCNVGVRRRIRTCNGIGQEGRPGACSGSDFDITTCNNEDCTPRVSEYSWSHWLNWGTCSATCNGGVRKRTRTCNGTSQDGLPGTCSGNDLDISTCTNEECTPRVSEYSWSHWLNWGTCSATCNVGVRRRTRTCNGTSQDGLPGTCSGNDLDISTCTNEDCTPRDSEGIWAPWSIWGKCSGSCNAGVRSRNRACKGQDGSLGICSGNGLDISSCNDKDCNQEPGPSNVSFTSYLSTSLTDVTAGTTVIFDKVLNNAGDAYSTSTGVFTCPTAGTYIFSLIVRAWKETNALNVALLIDGKVIGNAFSEPAFGHHFSTGTTTLVIHLNIGQQVWAETYDQNSSSIYKILPRFVGVLIHR